MSLEQNNSRQTLRTVQSKAPLGLLFLVLGIYILTMSGHTYSPDEETMLETSRAVVEKGTWAMSPSRSLVQVPGVDGQVYSQYGPAQSFAAVPWVAVGRIVGGLFPKDQSGYPLRLILGSYNALIMAGLVALFAAMAHALGYSRRAGLFSAGVLAFSTFLWPHSRTFFSEPLVALSLFASFYLLYIGFARRQTSSDNPPASRVPDWLPLLASGALFALAVATKVQYVVTLPAFLLYLGWHTLALRRPASQLSSSLLPALLWGVGLILGLLPLFLYNTLVFGGPLATGYGTNPASVLTTPFLEGLVGLLFSTGKGLIWYALPVLLTLFGWFPFARKHRPEAAFIALLSISILALFSVYSFWPGDGSWGPRYLTPALPFLLLPILPVVQYAVGGKGSGVRNQETIPTAPQSGDGGRRSGFPSGTAVALAVAIVVALGFFINLMGALVNFDTYINVVNDDATRYWKPDASPVLGHITLLNQRTEEWSLQAFQRSGTTIFRGGFSYSEGDKSRGEFLPRWTTGSGILDVNPAASGPLSITLRLIDHRPPQLPRATLTILLNGNPVTPQAVPVPPISTDYSFALEGNRSRIILQTDTWNPSELEEGGRNEDIGLKLESITLTQSGHTLPNSMAESLPLPPYYPQPRWYYDPGTHHLADVWPVYLFSTGMGRKTMLAVALPLIALSALLIFAGWRMLVVRQPRGKT
ncbi:MAG: phospholipid carrier-dependent glycosyltransferase [Chloroflexota bacterium]